MGGATEHRVEGRLAILPDGSGLLVTPDQEDGVVGRRGDRKGDQKLGRERRQPDQVVVSEEGHHTAGHRQSQDQHGQHQQHGDDRAVEEQQHEQDDADGGVLDELDALVAGGLLVGLQRRSAGDEDLHPGWRAEAADDLLHRGDGVVAEGLTHVAGEVDLDVGGLAVGALGAGPGQRIAPEVLDVLDVGGVGAQLGDHVVVEGVGVVAEGLVALQDNHRGAVGVGLLEELAGAHHRDDRRRLRGRHRHRPHLADDFQLGHGHVEDRDQRDPADDDGHRQPADPAGDPGPALLGLDRDGRLDRGGAHRVLTR